MRQKHAAKIVPPLPQKLGDGPHLGVCVREQGNDGREALTVMTAFALFFRTKTEKIKQIGNAVPVKTAAALCRALLAA